MQVNVLSQINPIQLFRFKISARDVGCLFIQTNIIRMIELIRQIPELVVENAHKRF